MINRKISRLKRLSHDDSNVRPCGIYFKDSWKWIDNDEIIQEQYNTSISKEWSFDKSMDGMEWRLLSN